MVVYVLLLAVMVGYECGVGMMVVVVVMCVCVCSTGSNCGGEVRWWLLLYGRVNCR